MPSVKKTSAARSPLAELRERALRRALGSRGSLADVIERMGYVQADPIRAPARAQDLILFQRVEGYRAGDLERQYTLLACEEDVVHNYGFVAPRVQRWLHPRSVSPRRAERFPEAPKLERVIELVRERGEVRPRDLDEVFERARTLNYWGGTSSEISRALEALHYRGDLRVARRERGVRVYAINPLHEARRGEALGEDERARLLLDLLVEQYAPLTARGLRYLVQLSGYGAPGLQERARRLMPAVLRRLRSTVVDGETFFEPDDGLVAEEQERVVRLVAPFDPLVWDRGRFEHLHGWAYRFEAYTPAARRELGYYALPLFWGSEAIGWANVRLEGEELVADLGFREGEPRSRAFSRSLDEELERMRRFLME